MLLPGSVLFYWIRKSFPEAKMVGSAQTPASLVHNLFFWEGKKTEEGRCVLITDKEAIHNVALPSGCVFLIAADYEDVKNRKEEIIVLPGNISVDKICNCVTRIFEKFDEWENRLEHAVSDGISFQSIIRSCDYLVSDPLALNDLQFRYIAYSKKLAVDNGFENAYVDDHNFIPLDVINIITSDPQYALLADRKGVFRNVAADDFLHKNVFYQGSCVGRLSIPYSRDSVKNDYYAWILLVIAEQIERLYETTGTFWSNIKQNQSVKELFSNLMAGTAIQKDKLHHEMALLGHEVGQRYILILLQPSLANNRDKLNKILSTQIEDKYPGAICIIFENRFYILMNLDKYQAITKLDFYNTLAVFLRESLLKAGASRVFRDFSEIQTAARQTEGAIEIGEQKHPMYWYYKFDDYAFDWLLLKGIDRFLPDHVASQVVLSLQHYDQKNGTELEKTLRVYIQNHYNAVNAAKALFIARSSFLRRLERIEALTKIDWDNERTMTYISLSFQLFDAMSDV